MQQINAELILNTAITSTYHQDNRTKILMFLLLLCNAIRGFYPTLKPTLTNILPKFLFLHREAFYPCEFFVRRECQLSRKFQQVLSRLGQSVHPKKTRLLSKLIIERQAIYSIILFRIICPLHLQDRERCICVR